MESTVCVIDGKSFMTLLFSMFLTVIDPGAFNLCRQFTGPIVEGADWTDRGFNYR